MDDSPAMIRLQAKHIQTSLESLVDIFGGCDWQLRAQVALWVAAGSVIMRMSDLTSTYIRRGCEAVNTAGLQFIPTYGRPPAFSEDLHEKLSVLSQIIYFENFLFLTCGGAEPTMTAGIEREFRHRLQVRPAISSSFPLRVQHSSQEVYPVLFKICPLTMRTQAILLVRDTVITLDLRPVDGQYRFVPSYRTNHQLRSVVTRVPTWHLETIVRSTSAPSGQLLPCPAIQSTEVSRTRGQQRRRDNQELLRQLLRSSCCPMRDPLSDGAYSSDRVRHPLRYGIGTAGSVGPEYAYGGIHPSRSATRGVYHPATAGQTLLTNFT